MTALAITADALSRLDRTRIELPKYDRTLIKAGVLHLGPGAFHRAHQAVYFDQILSTDPGYGVVGVSMRSTSVKEALAPQDFLYTLAILDDDIRYRIIGSLLDVIAVNDSKLAEYILSPDLKIISLTVTEKGYCLNADGGLDFDHPDIRADLVADKAPCSAVGLVTHCLDARMKNGLAAPDVISCDNLSGNGGKLRAAVVAFAEEISADLARWIEDEVNFPNTMVDSITPATDDALRQRLKDEIDVVDKMPVQREAFSDWIIEDNVATASILRAGGAVITREVEGFEKAKLRMLNGAHSTLAYRGLARGFHSVGEAMNDPAMKTFIDALLRIEIAPSLTPPPGLDLDAYRIALLGRFSNPSITHLLAQIAWDGSQKLPIRLFGTIIDNFQGGRPINRLCVGVAAWMRFVVRGARSGGAIVDPIKDRLLEIGDSCNDRPDHDVDKFLIGAGIFPHAILSSSEIREALAGAYAEILGDEISERRCA